MKTRSVEERFWKKVDKRSDSECWEWAASRDMNGYGRININGINCTAHRLSWEIRNGEIPHNDSYHGTCVLHMCDNPPCVNPSHLFLGTSADNAADRNSKGRHTDNRGEQSPLAKLNDDKVRTIRASYPAINQPTLAARFGVSQVTISSVLLRNTWGHVK